MATFVFILGTLSLMSPIALMILDGVEIGDESASAEWMINQPLERMMLMRSLVVSGIMLMFTSMGLALIS